MSVPTSRILIVRSLTQLTFSCVFPRKAHRSRQLVYSAYCMYSIVWSQSMRSFVDSGCRVNYSTAVQELSAFPGTPLPYTTNSDTMIARLPLPPPPPALTLTRHPGRDCMPRRGCVSSSWVELGNEAAVVNLCAAVKVTGAVDTEGPLRRLCGESAWERPSEEIK